MPAKGMVMTEIQKLKIMKTKGTANPEELTRLKVLQDGEPLSKADLDAAVKREEDRNAADKAEFDAKKTGEANKIVPIAGGDGVVIPVPAVPLSGPQKTDDSLDIPPDHPRVAQLKAALAPFTQIEAHDSRPDEFVLFTRDISITAGDVRTARKAMQI